MLGSDWVVEGGRFLPQAYINLSMQINEVYQNLEIGMLRSEDHLNPENKDHPFCLMQVFGNGEIKPVKYLREDEMDIGYLMWWLKKNGTTEKTANDHFNEFLDEMRKDEAAKRKIRNEKTAEEADVLATIASSPLHTFRHNGNNIGADNNVPTLMKKEKEWL